MRCGIDSLEIARFITFFERTTSAQLRHIFTEEELAYGKAEPEYYLKLAARFAAKEACLKCFPAALAAKTLDFIDIGISHDAYGAPIVLVNENLFFHLEQSGFTNISISLSHTKETATAMAIVW